MFKATSRYRAGSSPSGLVDVVDRSTSTKANRAFTVTAVIIGVLAAVIASDQMHPILAVFLGALIGAAAGAVVWAAVFTWPVVKRIWWWLPELTVASLLFASWTVLATYTSTLVTGLVVAVAVGVPAGVAKIRRGVIRLAWCLVTRHRIRHCFTTFILTNRYDSDPFILWARPIEAGERVYVWLRPGLAIDGLQNQVKQIASGCWSDEVTIERASDTNSAYVRFDVKRRDPLRKSIPTPLLDGIATTAVSAKPPKTVEVTNKLDLTDIAITDVAPVEPTHEETKPAKKPPKATPSKGNTNGTVTGPGGEDISDYIDD